MTYQHPTLETDELDTFEGRWSANGTLARIIERMRGVSWDASIKTAWVVGLNRTEDATTRDVIEGIGETSRILRQAKAEAELLDPAVKKRSVLHWPKVEELLNHPNLDEPWKRFSTRVDDGLLERLIANHHALGEKSPLAFSNEYLADLRSELFGLLVRIESAEELPKDLRFALVKMVEGIINAINAYRWSGPDGLRKELVEFNFNLAVHHEAFDANKRNPIVQETMQKVGLLQNIVLWIRRDVAVAGFVAQAFIAPVVQAVATEAIQRALPRANVEQLRLPAGPPVTPGNVQQPDVDIPPPSTPAPQPVQTPV